MTPNVLYMGGQSIVNRHTMDAVEIVDGAAANEGFVARRANIVLYN